MKNLRHDKEKFYHCDCLELGTEHDKERFYHCDCIESREHCAIIKK